MNPKKDFMRFFKGIFVDKTLVSHYINQYNCSNRFNHIHYCIEIYATYPVYEKENEALKKKEPVCWLGISFKDESGSLRDSNEYLVKKMEYLEKLDPNRFWYLERMTDSHYDSDLFETAIHNRQYPFDVSINPLIFMSHYEPFTERVKYDFGNLFCVLIVGTLVWFGICYLMIHEDVGLREI